MLFFGYWKRAWQYTFVTHFIQLTQWRILGDPQGHDPQNLWRYDLTPSPKGLPHVYFLHIPAGNEKKKLGPLPIQQKFCPNLTLLNKVTKLKNAHYQVTPPPKKSLDQPLVIHGINIVLWCSRPVSAKCLKMAALRAAIFGIAYGATFLHARPKNLRPRWPQVQSPGHEKRNNGRPKF